MTVRAVAFLPVAPGLVPAIARGASGDLDAVRDACHAALGRVLDGSPVVVVGPLPTSGVIGSARGFGVDLDWRLGPGEGRLPWAQAVGAWFLAERGLTGTACGPQWPDSDVVVLAMGDGSCCRTPGAPGAFDERAEAWDTTVADGLAAGRLDLVADLGRELGAVGVPVWAGAPAGPWDAVLHHHSAPQGVGLLVASWVHR